MTRVANQGPVFLAFLQERGADRRGWADMTVKDMVAPTGITTHDLTKMLRAWQKLGIVKFTVHHEGSVETLGSIRLTTKGLTYKFPEARTMSSTIDTPIESRNGQTSERLGDQLDAAIGASRIGVIGKRSPRPPVSAETKAQLQADRDAGLSTVDVASKNHVSLNTVIRYTHPPKPNAYETSTEDVSAAPAPTKPVFEPPVDWKPRVLLHDLPLIAALSGRQERLLSAAAAIEADAPDLAETIVARAQDTYSAIEREVLTLLDRIGAK